MAEMADMAERASGAACCSGISRPHALLYWNAASALVVADRFDAAHSAIDAV